MKFTKFLSLITLASGMAYAKSSNQCIELQASLGSKNIKCVNDKNGKATELKVNGINFTDNSLNEILNLKSLNEVEFEKCNFEKLSAKYYNRLNGFDDRCPIMVSFKSSKFGSKREPLEDFGCFTESVVELCSGPDSDCHPNEKKTTSTKKKATSTKKKTTSTRKRTTTLKKKTTTTLKKKTTTAKKIPTSTVSSRCGPEYGACAHKNSCCSKYNWCGRTSEHCGVGCQPKYGLCNN